MMKNVWHLTMRLRSHPDNAIMLYTYWPPPVSIWICHLNDPRCEGKVITISRITTTTRWRLAVHFGSQTYSTGDNDTTKPTPSMLISPMRHAKYCVSYHMVFEWSPVLPLGEMLLAGGSQKAQGRLIVKKSLYGSLLNPIAGSGQVISQYRIQRTQNMPSQWRNN
jgi:hypothetical protein